MGPYAEVKSSDFKLRLKVLRVLADLQFNEREFQTAGVLTEKALADKASVTLGAVSSCLPQQWERSGNQRLLGSSAP